MQQQINNYRDNGFLHLPNFFPKSRIEEIRQEARYIFELQLTRLGLLSNKHSEKEFEMAMYQLFKINLKTFSNCGKQAQHLISLHKISLESNLMDLLKNLDIKHPIISTRPVLFFNSRFLANKESYWKTPPHQDWRSIQGSINSVVVWLPLIDIDIDLGAIEVIPKSHKEGLVCENIIDSFGLVLPEFRKDELFIPLEVKQGDIVIFSQFLIHRSGNNITESIRWSCHFRYNDLDEDSFINRSFPHTYIYRPDDTLLFPEFQTKIVVQNHFNHADN